MQDKWEKAKMKNKGTKDLKFIHEKFLNKIHQRFGVLYLSDLFTVDVED